jgi:hypothetical protein
MVKQIGAAPLHESGKRLTFYEGGMRGTVSSRITLLSTAFSLHASSLVCRRLTGLTQERCVHSRVYNDLAYVALLDVRQAYADEIQSNSSGPSGCCVSIWRRRTRKARQPFMQRGVK